MKLLCSLLLLLLYLAVTGRSSDAQLLQQSDDVYSRDDNSVVLTSDGLDMKLDVGSDTIDVSWNNVTGWTKRIITCFPADNGNVTCIDNNHCEFYNLEPCSNYNITLVLMHQDAVNTSATKSTTTLPADPDKVSTITVEKVLNQSSQLAVSWPQAEGAGKCAITYRITWTPESGGESIQNTTSDLSYTITGLAACTSYSVCVAATTDGGYFSGVVCHRQTTDEDTPGPVVSLSVDTLSDSSLAVSWSPPDNLTCIIINYNVAWSEVGGLNQSFNTMNTSYAITDLHPCTLYTVIVTAFTAKGPGIRKSKSSTTDSIAPDPPMVTAVMVVDESEQLSVNWTQPDAPGPQCPITRYNVTWHLASTHQLVDQTTTSNTRLTISNLEAWTNYTVCVAAAAQQNSVDKYSEPSCTDAETDQDTPGPTSNTTITSQTAGSLLVVWDPPEEPRGIITNYSVTWSSPDTNTEATVDGSTTQYNITSLDPCVTYTVTVTAATCKGYGERNDDPKINGTTDPEPPPSPSVTCEEVVSPHQATVTWPPVITTCTVTGYSVNYTGDVLWSDDTRHDSLQLLTTHADLSDLTPWTTYTVCVAGVVVNNIVGAWSCCYSTTLEAEPGPPAEINQTSSSTKSVTLTWVKPEELNGVLTGYQLTWDTGNTTLHANITTYTISDLHHNTQYNVTLKAGTEAGWGDPEWAEVRTEKDKVAGAVAGGVVGGLVVVSGAVAAFFYSQGFSCKKVSNNQTTRSRAGNQETWQEWWRRVRGNGDLCCSPHDVTDEDGETWEEWWRRVRGNVERSPSGLCRGRCCPPRDDTDGEGETWEAWWRRVRGNVERSSSGLWGYRCCLPQEETDHQIRYPKTHEVSERRSSYILAQEDSERRRSYSQTQVVSEGQRRYSQKQEQDEVQRSQPPTWVMNSGRSSEPTTQAIEPITHASDPTTHIGDPTTHIGDPTTHASDPTTHANGDPTTHSSLPQRRQEGGPPKKYRAPGPPRSPAPGSKSITPDVSDSPVLYCHRCREALHDLHDERTEAVNDFTYINEAYDNEELI